MKSVSVRDLQKSVRASVEAAQSERVVITRRGRPAALLIGVQGEDWETVVRQTDAPFWKMIQKRRKQKTLPLAELRKRLKA